MKAGASFWNVPGLIKMVGIFHGRHQSRFSIQSEYSGNRMKLSLVLFLALVPALALERPQQEEESSNRWGSWWKKAVRLAPLFNARGKSLKGAL